MILIICTTNIDIYKRNMFPSLTYVPRKGEYVEVSEVFKEYCNIHHIPLRLEVVSITYTEKRIVVELWYNKTDFELYTQSGYKLL